MKKIIALVLCLVTIASFMAACGGGGNELQAATTGNAVQETIDANAALSEIPKDLTLTIGMPLNSNIEDLDTNAYTLWLEEVTGYELEFITFQSGATDYKAQLSSMLATGDELPDILYNFHLGASAYEEYGKDGYFIDLAPYYNNKELSKTFWDRMAELPEAQQTSVIKRLTADNGAMYAFARIENTMIDTMKFQVFINQDWLTKLNLDMPTDIKSLENVLRAFRDKDPNGNGKKDERPLIGGNAQTNSNIIQWIINMYCYNQNEYEYNYFNIDDNNKLYLNAITPEYRQALCTINRWIKEGLMYTTAFNMGTKEIKGMVSPPNGEDLTVGVWASHPTLVLQEGRESVNAYAAMPIWGCAPRNSQYFTPAVFITQDCEYPAAAWNLLMTMCSKEGANRQRYGEYGVDYVDADPNTVSFLGLPAEIKVINEDAFTGQNNTCYHFIMGTILLNAENEVCQLSGDMTPWVQAKMKLMSDYYNNYIKAENENNPDDKYIMPDIDVPENVSDADKNERDSCTGLINEALKSFCVGQGDKYTDPNNDAQWNAYIKELEDLGYKTWMEHRQMIYDDQYPERAN